MPPRSRQTRHQDAASRSRQGHVIDLDPTDGLPVQRYGLQKVQINQDASTDPASSNPKSTHSAEWAAQFNTPQHPWPERPLPSYFSQLAPWNQEMIRKARAGNTNPIISDYDRKTSSWNSGADQERRAAAAAKLSSLNITDQTEKPRNGNDADSSKSGDDSGAEDSSNEYNKSADEEEFDGDETTPFKPSAKRRKVASRHSGPDETRIIEVTKWVPLPPSQADKAQDKVYLAPRRPGMPPLYQPDYAQKMFGQYHFSASVTGSAGYDLGEGGGLSNASGVLAAGSKNDGAVATPRKNVPPRRKKKKIGGPGRKKANAGPVLTGDGSAIQGSAGATVGVAGQGGGTDAMEGVTDGQSQTTGPDGNITRNAGYDGVNDDSMVLDEGDNDVDNDNDNDSESEAEGSEEGEIDETGGSVSVPNTTQIPNQEREPTPLPTTTITVHDEVTIAVPAPTTSAEHADSTPTDEAEVEAKINEDEAISAVPSPLQDEDTIMTPTPIATTATAAEPEPEPEPVSDSERDKNPSLSTTPDTNLLISLTPTHDSNHPTPPTLSVQDPVPTATRSPSSPPTTTTTTTTPHPFTLPQPQNPEEEAIIQETVDAITGSGSGSGSTTIAKAEGNAAENTEHSEEGASANTAEEIDFLGGLDEAIDREVSGN